MDHKWIPVKYHYIEDGVYHIDSPLPADGQEILITIDGGIVDYDICCVVGNGYYLESGYDWTDVIAWMPLPEPYKEKHVMPEEPIAMSQSRQQFMNRFMRKD